MKRRMNSLILAFGSLVGGVFCTSVSAQEDTKGVDFFEKKIRPVLVANCYQCHSASSKEVKGELRLDTRALVLKGGESGPALVKGKPAESLLIQALKHENGMEMPPNQKLPDEVIADFEKWVLLGAPDPRTTASSTVGSKINYADARKFWAFQPPQATAPPATKDSAWAKTDIDRFLLARLEAEGLKPVADADKRTLLRRVYFDLIGLPPSPEETAAFLADPSPSALAGVIDRLLDTPQFGERWGRHWLDVARYGESTGKERNVPYPYAWRYRDYVFDAFTTGKPFDQFIREQIAGDLLPAKSDAQRREHLIATGFLALGPKGLNERNAEQFAMDVADEQLDVVTRGFMALSVACARCHDHKFDPIPQRDYYSMVGIFRSTNVLAGVERGNNKTGYAGGYMKLPDAKAAAPAPTASRAPAVDDGKRRELARLQSELKDAKILLAKAQITAKARIEERLASNPKIKKAAKDKLKAQAEKQLDKLTESERTRVRTVEKQIAALEGRSEPEAAAETNKSGDPAMAVQDSARPADCRINIRGEVADLGDVAPRGFVKVIATASAPRVNEAQSGRLQLAQWIASKENPLTARVIVNRVWAHLFGRGLAAQVDNFGALGEAPSHPELLDTLAVRFVQEGWSVKKLIRDIMLSRAYQMSSEHQPAAYAKDPDNQLLWRMNRRRLEAEAIRDAMLAVSGNLDFRRPEGSPVQKLPVGELGRQIKGEELYQEVVYRSAYLPLARGYVPEFLNTFDVADPELVVGQRDITTVATQALYLMNNPQVRAQSQAFAERVLADSRLTSEEARIDQAFQMALGRPATTEQKSQAREFLSQYAASLGDAANAESNRRSAWINFCQALFASAEFRYVY